MKEEKGGKTVNSAEWRLTFRGTPSGNLSCSSEGK